MKRTILLLTILLTLLLNSLSAMAHYTLHAVSGDVKIESQGKSVPATPGMSVKASDYVIIPQGGKVEIKNDIDKRLYSSIKPGKITVTRLMIEAKGVASDNASNVASKMRFGKKESSADQKVYVEKGMVRRSLAVYDPEGDQMEMNPSTLGAYVARWLSNGGNPDVIEGIDLQSNHLSAGGLGFRLENQLGFPVYFNVIKFSVDNGGVEISPLGQPAGSYVVLPMQSLSREHLPELPSTDRHLVIITNCQYDIDEVIDEISKALSSPTAINDNGALPVSIRIL